MRTSYFRQVKPEEVGIVREGVHSFLDAIEQQSLVLHSFMLLRHGKVAAQGFWHPYQEHMPHMLYSLSKSFTATAIGFAVTEGLLNVTDRVVSFFSEYEEQDFAENVRALTIKHLLTMTTGHGQDTYNAMASADDGDFVRAFLSLVIEHESGKHFIYNNGATYMLSAIVQQVTGETVRDYLMPRLFMPLHIEKPTWQVCAKGRNIGAFGLSLKTEDIAKFGQLLLQNGQFEGKTVISATWLQEATKLQVHNGDDPNNDWHQGYGYQLWRCRHGAYRGDGAFGQFCVVMPEQDAVFVSTAGTDDMGGILQAVWDHLLPAMQAETPMLSLAKVDPLALRLEALSLKIEDAKGSRQAFFSELSGINFRIDTPNWAKLQAVRCVADEGGFTLIALADGIEHRIEGGWNRYDEGVCTALSPYPGMTKVAVRGSMVADDELLIKIVYTQTPFMMLVHLKKEEDSLWVTIEPSVSFDKKGNTIAVKAVR